MSTCVLNAFKVSGLGFSVREGYSESVQATLGTLGECIYAASTSADRT